MTVKKIFLRRYFPHWKEKDDYVDRFLWSSNLRFLMRLQLMDLFVHTKGQIFEVPNKSQLPGEQHPGFQAARNDTNIITQAEHCGSEWLLCCWMEVLQAEHPGLCPLASLCPSRPHSRTAQLSPCGHCRCLADVIIWIQEYIHIWATCVPKTLNLNKPESGEKRSLCSQLHSWGAVRKCAPRSLSGFQWSLADSHFNFF